MSLTFEVTIPVGSLETLRSAYSTYQQPVFGSWGSCEDTKAIKNVCDCVMDAFTSMPYSFVAKQSQKEDETSKSTSYPSSEDPLCWSEHGDVKDDDNDEYDKVSADEWEVQSASTSAESNNDGDKISVQDAVIRNEYDDEDEEYGEEEEQREEDEHRMSCEGWVKPKESDASEVYQFPQLFDVIIEMDGTGMSLRITVGPYDTWNHLTENLQREITLPPNGVVYLYSDTTYGQGDHGMMMKVHIRRYR